MICLIVLLLTSAIFNCLWITYKSSVKKWSKEDYQARIIQTAFRKYLAKKKSQRLRNEKKDYEELMVKLEKEVTNFYHNLFSHKSILFAYFIAS